MTFKFLDRAAQSMGSAPGTGPVTLGGALAGYQSFSQAGVNNADTFSYLIVDGLNWEYGVATYTSVGMNGTLTRTTITKTSAQNTSPISVSSAANVSAVLRAEDISEVSTLEGLADVSINEAILTDGQVLAWDITLAKWQAATLSVSGTLHGLSDVNVTEGAPIDGYTLNWDQTSGKWIAVVPVTPGGSGGSTSGAGKASGSSTANANMLINQPSGGAALTVSNNGSAVDTAATTLNFVNATSITTSSHDVTIVLPTGGGGGGGGTYDLSAGVPALSGMTQVNNTNQTFHESAGKAINVQTVTAESNVICGARLAAPGSTPYRVAIFLQSATAVSGHCFVAGFSDGTKYAVMLLKEDGNFWVYGFSNSSSPASALLANTVQSPPREMWFGLRNDGTNIFYEISADGVNFQTVYTETISGGYLAGSYTDITWGHIPFSSGPQAVTLRCYDVAGLTRSFP